MTAPARVERSDPESPPAAERRVTGSALAFRVALAIAGAALLAGIVRSVGFDAVVEALGPALRWLPLLCALELLRYGCETLASAIAFGPLASRIPLATLFRAHVIGSALSAFAPAPRMVNETIKVGLLAPHAGGAAATSVGFINQAATLIAVGLFSIPCGAAILALGGASTWFWASLIHAVTLVSSGVVLQAVTRADAPGRWLVRKIPRLGERAAAFRAHASRTGLFAVGPTSALVLGRCVQAVQFGCAARAVGIDVGAVGAMAAEGVNLLAAAVGVLVPGGIGTSDGAFTLAAGLLGTAAARATSLALLMRCVQLLWVPVASVMALVGRRERAVTAGRRSKPPSDPP
jgi:hypothetical protein